MEKTRVALVRQGEQTVFEAVKEAVDRIGGIGNYLKRGQSVILKSNYTGNVPEDTGGVTSCRVLESVIRLVKEGGAGEVTILEGCGTIALGTQRIFENLGVTDLAAKYGVRLLDANLLPMRIVKDEKLCEMGSLAIAEPVFDGSLIINIPVMKTHPLVEVTVAMKNMNGLLSPADKRRFHEVNLRKAIAEYHTVLPPYLTIVDGLTGMEGMGPVEGMPVPLGVIMAGENPAAVDAVAARVMGFCPEKIPYLQYAKKAGIGPVSEEEIEVTGAAIEEVRREFAPALPEPACYPGVKIWDEPSPTRCIGCRAVMSIALNRLKAAGDLPEFEGMGILINKSPESPIELTESSHLFCIGACTRDYYEKHKNKLGIHFIPGCAPAGLTVEDTFRGIYNIPRTNTEITAALPVTHSPTDVSAPLMPR